ncbi:MAG: SGNH/GDSL hydrolase family protein [Gammaproteobacteria bacterium]|uniref:Putative GDSL-like lipase/acylhydrolase n=1 Tax=viral metagenome TaxID=1070528 RepID=A0A6M3XVZ7_9ZZZZ|nr:SGNH/GDSL hydrolase family protein [Gammaproteobacteria bacterium]MBU1477427.1 SGNH/GDSL hydrolase family protein [Gammaproteobacteria bacterium]MBU2002590.1 SGNH/GDSL hydrolase family protein [Gammaproteobacteria bacterium]MBU2131765.1 SGNH/GDSL hydrolase family protein [Gammaproteobacteria bacterium]MBU2186500.1 SGNH/GDSL hydrolase family protein [Gammaproteobacteria bacterium]
MHPLRNGSQATARPAAKPVSGSPGWFTESGDENKPSYPGADWFNHVIAEFQTALATYGVTFDPTKEDHLSKLFEHMENLILLGNTETSIKIDKKENWVIKGRVGSSSPIMLISDSFGAGLGASTYTQSFAYKLSRSIFNAFNRTFGSDTGVCYETNLDMSKAWLEPGMPGNGGDNSSGVSFVNQGLLTKQLKIPADEWFSFKTKEVNKIGFFYDGLVSTATSAEVYVNNILVGTLSTLGSISGSHSGFVTYKTTENTRLTDVIKIVAIGGDLYVTGMTTHAYSATSPYFYIAARSGWTFNDFNTTEKLDELTSILGFNKSDSTRRLVILDLGPNSMYQSGRAQTPAEFVSSLNDLKNGITSKAANTSFLICVPAKADPEPDPDPDSELVGYPIYLSEYSYEDYRDAILNYADSQNLSVVRFDLSPLSQPPYGLYADKLHPNDLGHEVKASEYCDALGINLNQYLKTIDFKKSQIVRKTVVPMSAFVLTGGAPVTIRYNDVAIPLDSILDVKLRTLAGVEVSPEMVRNAALSEGLFWNNLGASTRFFYVNSKSFVANAGYYYDANILRPATTDVDLVIYHF